jgi:hypothetical protein
MPQNKLALLVLLSMAACSGSDPMNDDLSDPSLRSPTEPGSAGGAGGGQAGTSQSCTLVGCGPAVRIKLQTLPWSFEQMRTLTVEMCQNDLCLTGALASLTGEAPTAGGGLGLTLPLDGRLVSATVWAQEGGGFYVELSWTGPAATLTDGDVFSVKLSSPEGQIVDSVEKTVTYRTFNPNGPSCGPTCKAESGS